MPNIFRVTITVTGDEREVLNQRIRDSMTTGDVGSRVDLGCGAVMWLSTMHGDSIVFEADKTVIDGETRHRPPLNSLKEVSADFPELKFELFFWDLANDHHEDWRIQAGTGQLWNSVTLDHHTGDDIGPGTVHFVRDGQPPPSDEAIRENHWWDQPELPFDEELFNTILQSTALPLDYDFLALLAGMQAEEPQIE